tara:strand:+ start:125 stop:472 length:348 start_codon:yes stop_codon:yes gene_type:complete
MMSDDDLKLPELDTSGNPSGSLATDSEDERREKFAADLAPVFDVPVAVQAVIGRTKMEVADLMHLGPGSILELDRRVGEAIDIYVNSRLVARGEIVVVDERLGVTMTEIIKNDGG